MTNEEMILRTELSDDVLMALLRTTLEACREARRKAREYYDERLTSDAIPPLRRLEFETLLQDLVGPEIAISLEEHQGGHHTVLQTRRVILTAVTRSSMVDLVTPYSYRQTLARPAQLDMFEREEPIAPADKLYALLVYGGPIAAKTAGFANIRFPLPNGRFGAGIVDLFREFPLVVDEYRSHDERPKETMVRKAKPRLKSRKNVANE